jgi:hypothetical protein
MTRYTVTWVLAVQFDLAQLYLDATDPQAVTDAANAIDVMLATDPASKGTSMKEGLYSLDVPPLRVLYSVSESDRLVEVASVRRLTPLSSEPTGNGQDPIS